MFDTITKDHGYNDGGGMTARTLHSINIVAHQCKGMHNLQFMLVITLCNVQCKCIMARITLENRNAYRCLFHFEHTRGRTICVFRPLGQRSNGLISSLCILFHVWVVLKVPCHLQGLKNGTFLVCLFFKMCTSFFSNFA